MATLFDTPQQAWEPYEPSDEAPWDARRVAHLHRRAGFGASWQMIARDMRAGPDAAIGRVLVGDERGPDGRPAEAFAAVSTAMDRSFDQQPSLTRLQLSVLYRALFSPFPLSEKMSLAWNAHFATGFERTSAQSLADQHRVQRELWNTPVSQLHLRMLRDPAMLAWLDGIYSFKEQPNENLGREFLELFALGLGNYTEQDVKETARALTGWQRMADREELRMMPTRHDDGEKTILGQTGQWADADVVRIACQQPAAARHIARRLWRTFISDTSEPSAELLAALAERMRTPGDVDVAQGIETILRSRLFHADQCRCLRVASPVEFVACALRASEALEPCPDLLELNLHIARMGQELFQPPSVAGWPGGLEWLRGPTIVARTNFSGWLVDGTSGVAADHFLLIARGHGWESPTDRVHGFWYMFTPVPLPAERASALLAETTLVSDPARSCANLVAKILSSPEAQLL